MSNDDKMETAPEDTAQGLTGKLLLAMPGMGDPRFHKAVIFICSHDRDGAMGLVINHALPGIDMSELLEQLNIKPDGGVKNITDDIPVMSGGPVETARGFILHSLDFKQPDTIVINDHFGITGTIDALKAISEGSGPDDMLFILGYAGWSPGQLDEEMRQNVWLTIDADHNVVFKTVPANIWGKAVGNLGIDPAMLSGEGGTA